MNCVTHDGSFFLMFWPDIIQFGRITSDVVMGMSVTQSVRVGHIAKSRYFDPISISWCKDYRIIYSPLPNI